MNKIVPSGIVENDILQVANSPIVAAASDLSELILRSVVEIERRLKKAETECLARLNQYVPTDRPLLIEEAAAYLRMKPRTLDDQTRPGRDPVIPFVRLGGRKLFRKEALDAYLARHEVGKKAVKL